MRAPQQQLGHAYSPGMLSFSTEMSLWKAARAADEKALLYGWNGPPSLHANVPAMLYKAVRSARANDAVNQQQHFNNAVETINAMPVESPQRVEANRLKMVYLKTVSNLSREDREAGARLAAAEFAGRKAEQAQVSQQAQVSEAEERQAQELLKEYGDAAYNLSVIPGSKPVIRGAGETAKAVSGFWDRYRNVVIWGGAAAVVIYIEVTTGFFTRLLRGRR